MGLSPRHNDLVPSFRAIFLRPSIVDVNLVFCVSSAAHAAIDLFGSLSVIDMAGVATQYAVLLDTQNTSRQHEVMPRLGGRFVKEYECGRIDVGGGGGA